MQFFTHIEIKPLAEQIDYTSHILSLGSCFADNVARKLSEAKFRVVASPVGILFNPHSIASTLRRLATDSQVREEELAYDGERWFNYAFHSAFADPDKQQAIDKMQQATDTGAEALRSADTVIVTFGTAWVYRLLESGEVVANCHKQPHKLFSRELLSVAEIVKCWNEILDSALKGKRVIFTVSPIRHLGDGLEQNSLSKATLRVAIAELVERHPEQVCYFPSFEIMNDELRDYRFYDNDMLHPSAIAIDYIWQRFTEAAISKEAQEVMQQITRISQAASHRPFNPQAEAHKEFCRKQLLAIEHITRLYPTLDFHKERAHFEAHL
jgi:hypothetical protein